MNSNIVAFEELLDHLAMTMNTTTTQVARWLLANDIRSIANWRALSGESLRALCQGCPFGRVDSLEQLAAAPRT